MHLKITGKNFNVGDAFREHINTRIEEILEKLFSDQSQGHIVVQKEGPGFRTQIAIGLASGVHLQSKGIDQDVYGSFNLAAERLEKQLRRYKGKLKDHHDIDSAKMDTQELATGYIFSKQGSSDAEDSSKTEASMIIAENFDNLKNLSVGEAVIELDLELATLVMFRNASSGGLNVVYRRDDGNIGWIDPGRSE